MSKESKSQKPKKPIEVLELNRETVQNLAEEEAVQVQGGARTPEINKSTQLYTCGAATCNCEAERFAGR